MLLNFARRTRPISELRNHLDDGSALRQQRPSERGLFALMALWLLVVASGVLVICEHDLAAGPAARAEARWPLGMELPRIARRMTLVMVLHPMCPCSRASLAELAALQADCGNTLSIIMLFAKPMGLVGDVKATDLWRSAEHIEGTRLIEDDCGRLARKLGAATSGQVFLYDMAGALRFCGGITASRGHAGKSAGRIAIEAIVHGQPPALETTPVFGCTL